LFSHTNARSGKWPESILEQGQWLGFWQGHLKFFRKLINYKVFPKTGTAGIETIILFSHTEFWQ
jgi:hypothetical protein